MRKQQVKEMQLMRKAGYDTTNNLNKLLTQCFGCSIPKRCKETLADMVITKIYALEEHGVLDTHHGVMVGFDSVVKVLLLVREELESKDPQVCPVHVRRLHSLPAA